MGRKIPLFLLLCAGLVGAAAPPPLLPDGTVKPGVKITIPAGEQRELLFGTAGVRFLSGKARLKDRAGPVVDELGRPKSEIVVDADDKSQGTPWMHDEKPFRLIIHAITDVTIETRETWDWNPEKDLPKPSAS
ncbi:MAG TPA: hypothetical protein VGH16_23460 [Candidatus Binatia bacterium]|jgi:hypothetical protein